ncbi:GNAT family N-acetyltransferase [Chelativorans sp. AA-79]|uniref:GNAT family N-acetyltransferase n=1 Tax=Chelativorans sp. AA-79 TaxID=3028735 RepID=UPI003211E5EE
MQHRLRRLSLDEMDHAAIILRTAFDERLPWLAGLHTPEEDRSFFRDRVFAECEVWGAIGSGIVGFIAFREGWIDHLYILPKHRGKGAGDALLKSAKAASPSLQLWTFQKNAIARQFYEARGFRAIRETDGDDNEEREPDVLYRWERQLCGTDSLSGRTGYHARNAPSGSPGAPIVSAVSDP